ncbi:permease [Caloranaerobacter azorensis]|nr:permease [Caloranaerobacter azorensis]
MLVLSKEALKKSWKAFSNILSEFLGVIILLGILLSIFNAHVISRLIGKESGWGGIIASAIIGAITLIPGFVAFPTAALLLQSGAGYMQIGAFISALMMVGIITIPVENRYFGKKLTILRNSFAFLFSFLVAYVIGKVVGGI